MGRRRLFLSVYFEDVHLNWLKWFLDLIYVGGLPFSFAGRLIFLWPFLDITRMSDNSFFLSSGVFAKYIPLAYMI